MHRSVLATAVSVSLLSALLGSPGVEATTCQNVSGNAPAGFTNLQGDEVRIYRDECGVPHIFAETNRGLFEAFGYAVAQDRLWQLEINRRSARGRSAEILGPGTAVASDQGARIRGLTDAELDARFAALNAEEQKIISAYVDGINRYIREVVAPDPVHKLPFEFHYLGIGVPISLDPDPNPHKPPAPPWGTRDVAALLSGLFLDPVASGTEEVANQTLLAQVGLATFDDMRWRNDPDAPVTIPAGGAVAQAFGEVQKSTPPHSSQLQGAAAHSPQADSEADALAFLRSLGVPVTLGSNAWVVSGNKSTTGYPMLFGSLQVGINTPQAFYEVQLKGGNGFNVAGVAVPGWPVIVIGRNDDVAWTVTTAAAVDNSDTYIETLCAGGTGYMFNGNCTLFQSRLETINVKGAASVQQRVLRSVHGPVVGPSTIDTLSGTCVTPPPASGICYTRKRVFALRGFEDFRSFLAFNRARNLGQFETGISLVVAGRNFLYADKFGNIAYWQAGLVPERAPGFDPRLPLPGDGSAEWTGGFLPIPKSINPTRGWLANWNHKPAITWNNPDHQTLGKQGRLSEIDAAFKARLSQAGLISPHDMGAIALDVSRIRTVPPGAGQGGDGREARFVKQYLLDALNAVPPTHALSAQAKAVLETWDDSLFADARISTTLDPGHVIFDRWLQLVLATTFDDDLLAPNRGSINMLIHVLDHALGGGSGVPPSRDYFNGVHPYVVMSRAMDQVLSALGPDPAFWSSQPRATVSFRRTNFPTIPSAGTILDANRGSYAQIVELSNPKIVAQNILTLGASGFVGLGPSNTAVLDPHFNDQLELYRNFEYKPMHFYMNPQLGE